MSADKKFSNMVRDRLAEMQAKAEGRSSSPKKEKNGTPLLSSDEQLTEFLNKVTEIDKRLRKMRDGVEQMGKLQKNILSTPLMDKSEAGKLEKISDGVFSDSTQLQKDIRAIRDELGMSKMEATHERMINTHVTRLNQEVTKIINDLRATQLDYIEQTEKLHKRKVEIVGGDNEQGGATGVDVNKIEAVFVGDFLAHAQAARDELREVEARHMEIKKIEGSVIEVNRLFKEINQLVMEQGETLNRIEDHVIEASVQVESGGEQLKRAREYQDSARKKKVCCLGFIVAGFVIVAVILVIYFVSQSQ